MSFVRREWPWLVAVLVLGFTWAVRSAWSQHDSAAVAKPLARLPLELGQRWSGSERSLPQRQLDILQASDLLLRDYYSTDEAAVGPLVLYVSFYQSQRTGATYHSPQNCLPGAGWQITGLERVAIAGPFGAPTVVNEVIIQKGLERQLVLYWYQDRGRIVASEYWAKGYMIWDSMLANRSDGALVRVSTNVDTDVAQARQQLRAFIADIWGPLSSVLPGRDAPEKLGALSPFKRPPA